jgi:hypothetical protein
MAAADWAGIVGVKLPFIGMAGPILMSLKDSRVGVPSVIGLTSHPVVSRDNQNAGNSRFRLVGKTEHAEGREIGALFRTNQRLIVLVNQNILALL